MRRNLDFKIQEGVFRDFRPLNVAECKNDPQRVPMKFEGGSFEPIKIFPKIFFTGSFSGSGPEIHRFVQTLEEVWVRATYSCNQLSLFISGSPRKRVLDFKIQNKTQLLHSKKKTHLLILSPMKPAQLDSLHRHFVFATPVCIS